VLLAIANLSNSNDDCGTTYVARRAAAWAAAGTLEIFVFWNATIWLPGLFLYDDKCWTGFYFARFVAFLELHVRRANTTATSGRRKRTFRSAKLAWLPL
jgi:hypothetical protein